MTLLPSCSSLYLVLEVTSHYTIFYLLEASLQVQVTLKEKGVKFHLLKEQQRIYGHILKPSQEDR